MTAFRALMALFLAFSTTSAAPHSCIHNCTVPDRQPIGRVLIPHIQNLPEGTKIYLAVGLFDVHLKDCLAHGSVLYVLAFESISSFRGVK